MTSRKVGEDYYHVGYSSYVFHNVLKWKEEYFELVKENYKETIKKLRYPELPDGLVMVDLETRQKAIKALEKQIPKKVLYEDVGFDCYYDANLYACIYPSCGLNIIEFSDIDVDSECNSDSLEDMFHSSMVHHTYIGMNNYCNRCGQKLDWGEENGR